MKFENRLASVSYTLSANAKLISATTCKRVSYVETRSKARQQQACKFYNEDSCQLFANCSSKHIINWLRSVGLLAQCLFTYLGLSNSRPKFNDDHQQQRKADKDLPASLWVNKLSPKHDKSAVYVLGLLRLSSAVCILVSAALLLIYVSLA